MTTKPDNSGLLVIDKPQGVTSHDVVAAVRGALHMKRVGHAGTLDPMATGVLVVGFGNATRLLNYIVDHDKTYLATIRLGLLTHNHVSGLLEIIIHVGCQSSVKERKVQTNVPCFCLFPFQVRSSQAAHIKRINHIGITILVVHHVSSCQSQVSQCRIYITEFTVTVGTP